MKAQSISMRKNWEKAIKESIKKMDDGGKTQKRVDSMLKHSVEDINTVMVMQETIMTVNSGLRFLNSVLSSGEHFDKFAKHMSLTSYFDLASYAPIFESLYRSIYKDAKFAVEVKLENTSSLELAKEKFEKFLMIVEQKALNPKMTASDLEKSMNAAAEEALKINSKYLAEASKVNDKEITEGITLIDEFFKMLRNTE
ncbi:hypothetical protein AAMO2058_001130200 [Amorphochlora amoebiformis]